MRTDNSLLTRVIPLLLAACLLLASSNPCTARTITVKADGTGDQETIQSGLDAATQGDTVLVMPGTYSGDGNRYLSFGCEGIALLSSAGAASTVIDCERADMCFWLFGAPSNTTSVISGFTITNGRADEGGAVYGMNASARFVDCVFDDNLASAGWGGAVRCWGGTPIFRNCVFSDNCAEGGDGIGGGAYFRSASPVLDGCTFTGNSAQYGGGALCLDGGTDEVVTGCLFDGNNAGHYAGAMRIYASSPTISNCVFLSNTSPFAGAAELLASSDPTFEDCLFASNSAYYDGGAIYCSQGSSPTISSTGFGYNTARSGGAIRVYSDCAPEISWCTFASNSASQSGGAIAVRDLSTAGLTSCTFWGNSAGADNGVIELMDNSHATISKCIISFSTCGKAVSCDESGAEISDSDVYGNAGGDWVDCIAVYEGESGNICADPLFCGAETGDLRLHADSPCAAEMSQWGILIGAWDVGCGSPVQTTSWGRIKAMYR